MKCFPLRPISLFLTISENGGPRFEEKDKREFIMLLLPVQVCGQIEWKEYYADIGTILSIFMPTKARKKWCEKIKYIKWLQ